MGAAAYNRGSRLVSAEADERMPLAQRRADRQAHEDESERMRARVAELERDLTRARRCIAELRRSKQAMVSQLRAELSTSELATSILCRVAFPKDPR